MATATVFREFFAVLSDSIQDPDDLAKSLYSKCLITKSVRDEATHVMYTRDKKTDVLLKAVESRIAIAREDPETLDVFLAVLRQPPHNLGKLCGRIRDTYAANSAERKSTSISDKVLPDSKELKPGIEQTGNIVGGSDNTVDPMTYDSQEFYSGCTNKEEPAIPETERGSRSVAGASSVPLNTADTLEEISLQPEDLELVTLFNIHPTPASDQEDQSGPAPVPEEGPTASNPEDQLLDAFVKQDYDKVLELLASRVCNPAHVTTESGKTLLHLACQFGSKWLNYLKFLVSEHQCDPASTDQEGNTPLHDACHYQNKAAVNFLLDSQPCNPNAQNKQGDTPLHIASKMGSVRIVRALLASGKINPAITNKDLEVPKPACESEEVSKMLSSYTACIKSHPFIPSTNVFVLGSSESDKTSLIRGILTKSGTPNIGSLLEHNEGIIPVSFHSRELGPTVLYKVPSHSSQYPTKTTLPLFGGMFILVIGLDQSESEIVHSTRSWLSFIRNHSTHSGAHLLVVGSHADDLDAASLDRKCSLITDAFKSSSFHYRGCIPVNCDSITSNRFQEILDDLKESTNALRHEPPLNYSYHILYSLLQTRFVDKPVCTVGEIVTVIQEEETPLPDQAERVYDLLSLLADESHIFLLPSAPEENIRESWVVTDVQKLLQHLISMLHKKEQFCPTGILLLRAFSSIFPAFNPQMVAGFLESLQFCYEIEPPNTDSSTPFEAYYFFPALARYHMEGLVFSGETAHSETNGNCHIENQMQRERVLRTEMSVGRREIYVMTPPPHHPLQEEDSPAYGEMHTEVNTGNQQIHRQHQNGHEAPETILQEENKFSAENDRENSDSGSDVSLITTRDNPTDDLVDTPLLGRFNREGIPLNNAQVALCKNVKDNKYVREISNTGELHRRTRCWRILTRLCRSEIQSDISSLRSAAIMGISFYKEQNLHALIVMLMLELFVLSFGGIASSFISSPAANATLVLGLILFLFTFSLSFINCCCLLPAFLVHRSVNLCKLGHDIMLYVIFISSLLGHALLLLLVVSSTVDILEPNNINPSSYTNTTDTSVSPWITICITYLFTFFVIPTMYLSWNSYSMCKLQKNIQPILNIPSVPFFPRYIYYIFTFYLLQLVTQICQIVAIGTITTPLSSLHSQVTIAMTGFLISSAAIGIILGAHYYQIKGFFIEFAILSLTLLMMQNDTELNSDRIGQYIQRLSNTYRTYRADKRRQPRTLSVMLSILHVVLIASPIISILLSISEYGGGVLASSFFAFVSVLATIMFGIFVAYESW